MEKNNSAFNINNGKLCLGLLIILLINACTPHQEETKMRRFVFDASISTTDISKVNAALEQIGTTDIVDVAFYKKDTIQLLMLDMAAHYNLNETRLLFAEYAQKNKDVSIISELINTTEPLSRIYKFEQKAAYTPQQGQLIPMPKKQQSRFVLTLEIVNDKALAEDYVEVHGLGKAWPEITQNMKTVGIHEMEIYLIGYRAFLIMDTKPDFDWDVDGEKWGTLPREKEWQAYVAKFQKTNPESKAAEKWETMSLLE